jgi:uncharacterized membrane protein YeiH
VVERSSPRVRAIRVGFALAAVLVIITYAPFLRFIAVTTLTQDFIGLKISIYTTLSTPLIKSAFGGPLFSCVVARVVSLGGGLILFFRDLTVSFLNLQ